MNSGFVGAYFYAIPDASPIGCSLRLARAMV